MDEGAATVRPARRGALDRFLDLVERVGNRLPDQVTIFLLLALLTLAASWLAARAGVSISHPTTGATIHAFDLLSREGLQWVFSTMVDNFRNFPPLAMVLAALIGVGVADKSGLFAAALKGLVMAVPRWAVTPTIVFAGVMSNVASDAGYVVLPPLAAMLFVSLGRHPLAGIAAAFAGVSGGFSANLLLSTLDPMLAGLTEQAARYLDPTYSVNAACNYYFLAVSTFLLTLVGWWVTSRVVEPRLGPWRGGGGATNAAEETPHLTAAERRGLIVAGVTALGTIAVMAWMTAPADGVLRSVDPQARGVDALRPFFASLVALIMLVFLLPGLAFGIAGGTVRSDKDVAKMMSASLATMGGYIVLAFFAAQFIAWFNKSNLGTIVALEGAALLRSIHLTGFPLMMAFVLAAATLNILISSASAKWAIMAPIFVPMLMLLGKSPETTQALYRVGDSVTNIITPLNAYIPVLLAVVTRYVPGAGLGTLIAAMLPYSLAFLAAWAALLMAWLALGWPLGPASPLTYPS